MSLINMQLTKRELDVLKLIIMEYSSKQISSELFLSFETIRSHRKKIISKLNVKSTAGIVRVALENDLVDLSDLYRMRRYRAELEVAGA
jgi:DNA-binding NarL/FixJ family response regulator